MNISIKIFKNHATFALLGHPNYIYMHPLSVNDLSRITALKFSERLSCSLSVKDKKQHSDILQILLCR